MPPFTRAAHKEEYCKPQIVELILERLPHNSKILSVRVLSKHWKAYVDSITTPPIVRLNSPKAFLPEWAVDTYQFSDAQKQAVMYWAADAGALGVVQRARANSFPWGPSFS